MPATMTFARLARRTRKAVDSLAATVRRLQAALLRARIACAENDLLWAEHLAEANFATRRARILALRARLDGRIIIRHPDAIAGRACREKRGMLA